ncbi:MAG: TetR/AcrR family transcriptional regulator [Microbacteriaceae bacterium]
MSTEVVTSRAGRKPVIDSDALIRAAWELFERDGYDTTTMSAIADRAGISRRTLFNHVRSKEALLFPGIEDYMAEFTTRLTSRPKDEPILNAMMAVVREQQISPDANEFTTLNGPNVKQARLRTEAVAYIKELSERWMNRAVIEWLGDNADNRIKAGIVSALVAQVTTEVARIQSIEGANAEAALARAMGIVQEILR